MTEKTSILKVPEKAKWVWSSLKKALSQRTVIIWTGSYLEKPHSQGLCLSDLTQRSLNGKNSSPSAFVENNFLTMKMPGAVIPAGGGQEFGEWSVHTRIWKALTYSLGSRRPDTYAALCTCTINTWDDPNLSLLADIEPLCLQHWRLWLSCQWHGWWSKVCPKMHLELLCTDWKTYSFQAFKEISVKSLADH